MEAVLLMNDATATMIRIGTGLILGSACAFAVIAIAALA